LDFHTRRKKTKGDKSTGSKKTKRKRMLKYRSGPAKKKKKEKRGRYQEGYKKGRAIGQRQECSRFGEIQGTRPPAATLDQKESECPKKNQEKKTNN